ncbi:MAG: MATE family efflux transporter [Burkholderiaceae bacterium]
MSDAAAPPRDPRAHRAPSELLDGPIARTLVRFSLPVLATNFLHSLSGTWAAIWISHALGATALAAVVTSNVFLWMTMGAAMGIGTAAGVAIGQSRGAGDLAAGRRVAGTALGVVLAVATVLGAAGWIGTPSILALMRTPAPALEHATTLLRLNCVAMPVTFTFYVTIMMMRGSGDARTPFRFSMMAIGLNLALSPLLLTGALGAPRLGIAGVALGGLAANTIALAALLWFVYSTRHPLALRGPELRHLRPDPALASMIVRRGLPMAAEALIVQGAYFTLIGMVNRYGTETAAAYGGAAQLWVYVQLPANAIAAGMSAMAAINIGAGRWDRVARVAGVGCAISASFAAAATLAIYALGDRVLGLFIPQGGEVLAIARTINHVALWGWIVLSVSMGLAAIVRANAAMLAPTLIFAVTMWGIRVPFASLLQPLLGEAAIWWSFPFGSIASALLAVGYYRFGRWRENRPMLASGAK